jgi:phosphatidylglycerophosphate synthase
MIRRAVLTWPAAGEPGAVVAGLSVLLRQLLSLQDAGIAEVWLEGAPEGVVPVDRRLTLRVRSGAPPADQPVLRARAGLVWHPEVPRRLARAGASADLEHAVLAPGEFVVAAGDAAGRHEAERRLYASLLKPSDGMVSRLLNRRLSLALTRLIVPTRLTPNGMTLVATAFGLAAIVAVLAGGHPWFLTGAVLLNVQSVLDGCDGELSRLKYLRSRLGEWLDQVADDVINLGYFVAVGVGLHRAGSTSAAWITGIGAASHLVYQAALYTALLTRGGGSGSVTAIRWWGQETGQETGRRRHLARLLSAAGRRDFFAFLYLPAALAGLDLLALMWSGVIFLVSGVTTAAQWLLAGGPEPAAAPAPRR